MDTNRVSNIYQDQGLEVLLVSKTSYNTCKSGFICSFVGSIQPVAIVICNAGESKAFDMQAKELSIEKLRSTFHELDSLMALT